MSHKIDGGLPVTPLLRTAAAAARSPVSSSAPTESVPAMDSLRLTGEATSLLNLQRQISDSPAFDEGKVAAVRRALEDGSYRIDAGNIANAMLEFDRQLAG